MTFVNKVCDLLISISQETLVRGGGKQDKEGKEPGKGVILDLIVEPLNLTAELPYLRPRSQALHLPISHWPPAGGGGKGHRCDGGDGGDPCYRAPLSSRTLMLPNNCQCSINPVYLVEDKITSYSTGLGAQEARLRPHSLAWKQASGSCQALVPISLRLASFLPRGRVLKIHVMQMKQIIKTVYIQGFHIKCFHMRYRLFDLVSRGSISPLFYRSWSSVTWSQKFLGSEAWIWFRVFWLPSNQVASDIACEIHATWVPRCKEMEKARCQIILQWMATSGISWCIF